MGKRTKNRPPRKLSLDKETLKRLENDTLDSAQGGVGLGRVTECSQCQCRNSDTAI